MTDWFGVLETLKRHTGTLLEWVMHYEHEFRGVHRVAGRCHQYHTTA